jgi:hypothetical protein
MQRCGLNLPAPPPEVVPSPAVLPVVPVILTKPDIYDNAKFEQIACAGLAPKYDGSPDNLVPMLISFTYGVRMRSGMAPCLCLLMVRK